MKEPPHGVSGGPIQDPLTANPFVPEVSPIQHDTSALDKGKAGTPAPTPADTADYSSDVTPASSQDSNSGQPGAATGDHVTVSGQNLQLTGINGVNANSKVPQTDDKSLTGPLADAFKGKNSVISYLESFDSWRDNAQALNQFKAIAYQVGLISSPTAGEEEVLRAWQIVVEEAANDNQNPLEVLKRASDAGSWNQLNPTLNGTESGNALATGNTNNKPSGSTITNSAYIAYMDPATAKSTLADAYYRLLGRMPNAKEYAAFMRSLYSYEDNANTGKFEDKTVSKNPSTAAPGAPGAPAGSAAATAPGAPAPGTGPQTDINTTTIDQRGVSTKGAEWLASQAAMSDPEYGSYQSATTFFNAFMKALAGPASGMTGSGPTVTAP